MERAEIWRGRNMERAEIRRGQKYGEGRNTERAEIWRGQNPVFLWKGTDRICFDNI
jgi:hypothetical protein